MTSSGLGFIDEQSEDGSISFSPGSTTPSINSVNDRSGSSELTTEGQVWAYSLTDGRPFPTSSVRISPSTSQISFSDGKFNTYQTNAGTNSLLRMSNTRDVQLQLQGDTDHTSVDPEGASVYLSQRNSSVEGFIGLLDSNELAFVSRRVFGASMKFYVASNAFVAGPSEVLKPATLPTPAISIGQDNIPVMKNGIYFGQNTLDYYDEFQGGSAFRTDSGSGSVTLSPTPTLYFTTIGRIVHCTISVDFDVNAAITTAEYIESSSTPVPSNLLPVGGVTANGPLFYSGSSTQPNPVWTVFTDGRIRLQASNDGTPFNINTIAFRQTLTWTRG